MRRIHLIRNLQHRQMLPPSYPSLPSPKIPRSHHSAAHSHATRTTRTTFHARNPRSGQIQNSTPASKCRARWQPHKACHHPQPALAACCLNAPRCILCRLVRLHPRRSARRDCGAATPAPKRPSCAVSPVADLVFLPPVDGTSSSLHRCSQGYKHPALVSLETRRVRETRAWNPPLSLQRFPARVVLSRPPTAAVAHAACLESNLRMGDAGCAT
mmetsp:Transcript_65115/g.174571  ORF Transcript_65115/g.174571 Transcript_65115/m.174571 type:complete len:214 (-) Transcript_65115:1789-2430(-)